MNKIVLGLVLALGVANVSAMNEQAQIEQKIEQSHAPKSVKQQALALAKNKAVIAAVSTLVVVSGVCVAAHFFGDDNGNVAQKGLHYVKTAQEAVAALVKEYGYTKPCGYASTAKDHVLTHKLAYGIGSAAVALLAGAIYDVKFAKKSMIKNLISKKTAQQQLAEIK